MAAKRIPTLTVEVCDKHIKAAHDAKNKEAVDNWLDIRLEVMNGSNLLFASPSVTKKSKVGEASGT